MAVIVLILREYSCGVASKLGANSLSRYTFQFSFFLFFFEVDFSYIRFFAEVFTYQSPFQFHVKDQHSSGALWAKLKVRWRTNDETKVGFGFRRAQILFPLLVAESEPEFENTLILFSI